MRKAAKIEIFISIIIILTLAVPVQIFAQGSIYGTVHNSDLSVPDSGEVFFIGYLDDSDEEIHIETCVGAGYDQGFWFDDFQNYMAEAPGSPYDYHFFNPSIDEGRILSKPIPSNSFQEENIVLTPSDFPPAPENFAGYSQPDSTVRIFWNYASGTTWRVYRRNAESNGSFFRIDDPSGNIFNPGVSDTFYIDENVDNTSMYNYLIIPIKINTVGVHSDVIEIDSNPVPFICGDVNKSGKINLLDITYLIRYLYHGDDPPPDPVAADCNGQAGINLLDITHLLNYLYKGGPDPICNR